METNGLQDFISTVEHIHNIYGPGKDHSENWHQHMKYWLGNQMATHFYTNDPKQLQIAREKLKEHYNTPANYSFILDKLR